MIGFKNGTLHPHKVNLRVFRLPVLQWIGYGLLSVPYPACSRLGAFLQTLDPLQKYTMLVVNHRFRGRRLATVRSRQPDIHPLTGTALPI